MHIVIPTYVYINTYKQPYHPYHTYIQQTIIDLHYCNPKVFTWGTIYLYIYAWGQSTSGEWDKAKLKGDTFLREGDIEWK